MMEVDSESDSEWDPNDSSLSLEEDLESCSYLQTLDNLRAEDAGDRYEQRLLLSSIPHLFLPKRTPAARELEFEKVDQFILGQFKKFVDDALPKSTYPGLAGIPRLLTTWENLQPHFGLAEEEDAFAKHFSHELKRPTLMGGTITIPIYVRNQNATVLLEKREEAGTGAEAGLAGQHWTMKTFRSALPGKVVVSRVGPLSMAFPERCEVVRNTELLYAATFARALHRLAVGNGLTTISLPVYSKGEQQCVDRRDVAEPFMISEWLVGILAPNEESQKMGGPSVQKKIRDEVALSLSGITVYSKTLPFRRSGMWMSIKVVLQLELLKIYPDDENAAKLIYKLLILRFLAKVCETYYSGREGEDGLKLDCDLMAQMLAKVGKRVAKLSEMGRPSSTNFSKIEILKKTIVDHVLKTVKALRKYMERCQFKKASSSPLDIASQKYLLPPRTKEEYLTDLNHNIPFLSEYEELLDSTAGADNEGSASNSTSADLTESLDFQRCLSLDAILEGECSSSRVRIWLQDTETFIKTKLDLETDSEKINKLIQTYVRRGLAFYAGNPIGFSQLVLVVLQAVHILDRRASASYPVITRYLCGIRVEALDCLLLPQREDMALLDEIVEYFSRRNQRAPARIGILTAEITPNSFPVVFAAQDPTMIQLRKDIHRITEARVEARKEGVKQAREEYKLWRLEQQQLLETQCSCSSEYEQDSRSRKRKIVRCQACETDAKKRCPFRVIRRPLPKEEYLQNAIVFELLIPQLVSDLRDCLAIFKYVLLQEHPCPSPKKHSVKWTASMNLIQSIPSDSPCRKKSKSVSGVSRVIALYGVQHSTGTKKQTSNNNLDVMLANEDDFIVDNELGGVYNFTYPTDVASSRETGQDLDLDQWLLSQCMFQVSTADNSKPYLSLQQYLGSWKHTQNAVITDQHSCDVGLSLREFITFGSVRAGHRIQLRNLYRGIANRSLSLEEEPLLQLILQTIWQVGPCSEADRSVDGGEREAHLDFEDEEFASEMLDTLEKIVMINEPNYSRPLVLMSAVVIAVRVMELNPGMFEPGYILLKRWRGVMTEWIRKIELEMDQQQQRPEDLKELKKILLQIRICFALSFHFSLGVDWRGIMRDTEDVVGWFHTITSLSEREEEEGTDGSSISPNISKFMQLLLNIGKGVALRLRLEEDVLSHPILLEALGTFVSQRWMKARECINKKMKYVSGTHGENNMVKMSYVEKEDDLDMKQPPQTYQVTFDLILGIFLVNGYPESRLTADVLRSVKFKRFFGHNAQLRVWKGSNAVSKTASKFHGKHYEFRIVNQRGEAEVVIKEVPDMDDGSPVLTLIDHRKLGGTISETLVENYTHWWDPKGKVLYFRRKPTQESDYDLPHEYRLMKEKMSDGWHLYDVRNGSLHLNIKSAGFETAAQALKRLELSQHLNVMLEDQTRRVVIHLPRYGLRFTLEKSGLECKEHPGFFLVGTEQLAGGETLLGLEQGIQLMKGKKRMWIVPNGKILVEGASTGDGRKSHQQKVAIDLEELRQPPYFTYEVDEVLKRLVAKKSRQAWLYLAALHGVTSGPLPDQFTGVTGTVMAVRILQSGFIWSGEPYGEECLKILEFIRGLSPRRIYYSPKPQVGEDGEVGVESGSIEVIKWPDGLPPLAAYDGYEIIVEKLLEDSSKLEALHPHLNFRKKKKEEKMVGSGSSQRLRMRGYFHYLNFYGGAAVKPNYFRDSVLPLIVKSEEGATVRVGGTRGGECSWEAVVQFASSMLPLEHPDPNSKQSAPSFQKDNLWKFLMLDYKLENWPDSEETLENSVKSIFVSDLDLKSKWFTLYGKAVEERRNEEDRHLFSLFLSYLAYKKVPLTQILNLHYISTFADRVNFPSPPQLSNGSLDEKELAIAEVLKQNLSGMEGERDPEKEMEIMEKIKDMAMHLSRLEIQETVERFAGIHPEVGMNREEALKQVISLISEWDRSQTLMKFVKEVQEKLNHVHGLLIGEQLIVPSLDLERVSMSKGISAAVVGVGGVELEEGEMDLDKFLNIGRRNTELWEEAKRIFATGKFVSCGSAASCTDKVNAILRNLSDMMRGVGSVRKILLLYLTGSCPRTDPTSMLQRLLGRWEKLEGNESDSTTRIYAGALAVLWTHLQRHHRAEALDSGSPEHEREMANEGYANWSPEEFPEWVVLQLELNLMIRPLQVDVAKRMMQMPDEEKRNGVMQLNMGEGKTAVIVPMLCLVLGRGETLCRVTVLGSMFNTNYSLLSFAIGRVLDKRVYKFPFRRDMNIGAGCVDRIQKAYEECMRMGGVVLTLPEHRLSPRLLAHNQLKMKTEVSSFLGKKLLGIENWLRKHARDVLDESDELLQVKYQLVYTVGEQISLDGGELRWKVCQKVLRIVEGLGREFLESYGPSKVELDGESCSQKPHQFSPIRLLDEGIHQEFVEAVADRYLAEVAWTSEGKQRTKEFLTEEEITEAKMEETLRMYKDTPELLQSILLVSGFLRRGLLILGLSKRWRVEYGVDKAKCFRRMAVPFRAKDVAAERTEFGHPDLAILLTHLSYYYSGLSDKELFETFEVLEEKTGPEDIYSGWIELIPIDQVSKDLLAFRGINLKDTTQRRRLFELLRKHKLVVDFWLSNKVFPREAKQFPAKMVMTAWDLCYEKAQHPVTGFSGTNDSSVLLPLGISQQDLSELINTNSKRTNILLCKENCGKHLGLTMGVTCLQILTRMKENGLRVLIDAGALMLDCDNEQLASKWLEVDPDLEAVVYFNSGNELMLRSRPVHGQSQQERSHDRDVPFELSSFQGRLGQCGVYLDDQHTRGTDLGFPVRARACVTVGGRMRRDKLIQACWRMRQLGRGHHVTFYLFHEAHIKVNGKQEQITTEQVLNWVDNNTRAYNEDGLPYWALAGRKYAQRLAAEDNFDLARNPTMGSGGVLGEMCVDDDVSSLEELYGQKSKLDLLVNAIPLWFQTTMAKLKFKNYGYDLPPEVSARFLEIRDQIVARCQEHVPTKNHHAWASMEEEQEKEIEEEDEEERQIEHPEKATPIPPLLHENVKKVVLQGKSLRAKDGIKRLCDIFKNTPFFDELQPDGWGNEVFATNDFITVILNFDFKSDQFLRPIEYLISVESQRKSQAKPGQFQLLLLSPFEVNELMPQFRSGNVACRLHMFSLRESKGADLLLNNSRLMLPHSFPVAIPEDSRITAALLVASGSLYFRSMEEQKAFVNFLSLAPMPWTEEEEDAFKMSLIKKTGFMLPRYEGRADPDKGFRSDPTFLVRKILMIRHPALSRVAHVVRLLDEKRLVPFVEERSEK